MSKGRLKVGLVLRLSLAVALTALCSLAQAQTQPYMGKQRIKGLPSRVESNEEILLPVRGTRKVLGLLPVTRWVYAAGQGKSKTLARIAERVGQRPVYYSDTALRRNAEYLRNVLERSGHFRASVSVAPEKVKAKEVDVTYQVSPGPLWMIDEIELPSPESVGEESRQVLAIIRGWEGNLQSKVGQGFSYTLLQRDIGGITAHLQSIGYYYFNESFLEWEADTNGNQPYALNVRLLLAKPKVASYYQPYATGPVVFRLAPLAGKPMDSVKFLEGQTLVQPTKTILKPSVLRNVSRLRVGQPWQPQRLEATLQRLSSLGVMSQARSRLRVDDSAQLIYVEIVTQTAPPGDYTVSSEVSNVGGGGGINGRVVFRYKNLLRTADRLELSINGGAESQPTSNPQSSASARLLNTLEYGASIALVLPRVVLPFVRYQGDGVRMPNTRFELAYNFQSRFDYERSILSAGYVLLLTPTNLLQLTLVPAEASVVRSFTSPAFEALLAQPQNIYLRGAFVPHVTLATRAVAVYGAAPNTSRRYGQVTAGLEGADNFLDLAYQIIKPEVEAGQRRLGTLPYFQYIKLDLDAKRGVLVGRRAMLAGRLWGGVGVPLGPLQSLPIERRYFAGGSNSIRAWQARTLGPGSYLKRKSDPDQFGEVHLEGSLEYRFARTGFFQPAVFVDAGNLWTLKERGTSRGPQTDFEFLGLARDIAIGGGLGLRFDFQFFLLRLDLGMKLRDPSYPLGDAWIGGKYFSEEWRDAFFAETGFEYGFTNLNLAIGLPF